MTDKEILKRIEDYKSLSKDCTDKSKLDEFINKYNVTLDDIADAEYDLLSDECREYLKSVDAPICLHMTYGMYIRNKYLWGNPMFQGHPDDISHIIISKILDKVLG